MSFLTFERPVKFEIHHGVVTELPLLAWYENILGISFIHLISVPILASKEMEFIL